MAKKETEVPMQEYTIVSPLRCGGKTYAVGDVVSLTVEEAACIPSHVIQAVQPIAVEPQQPTNPSNPK